MQSDEFYKARDAVENEHYKKENSRQLKKHIVWLKTFKIIDDPNDTAWHARYTVDNMIKTLNIELERRRDARLKFAKDVGKGVLIGVLVLLAGMLLRAFVFPADTQNKVNEQTTKQNIESKQSIDHQSTSMPLSSPSSSQNKRQPK